MNRLEASQPAAQTRPSNPRILLACKSASIPFHHYDLHQDPSQMPIA
jgi:hypothetical protein